MSNAPSTRPGQTPKLLVSLEALAPYSMTSWPAAKAALRKWKKRKKKFRSTRVKF